MRASLVALAVAAPFAMGVAVTPSPPHGTLVMTMTDPAIVEASALVVQDGLFLTTNDSGDTGRVFAVDGSGRTVGVTHWSGDPTDCEALAPAGPGHVWVGDIGDNTAERPYVSIARIPIGHGDLTVHPTIYRLTYPHGATDAETLVRNPATGRLYVASKNFAGGTLYAVPRHLSATEPNRLTAVGRVLPIATDGSFFPDGRHLVIRNYTSAEVYDWPSLQPVGSSRLPAERQGEGIAATSGSVYLSSEGPQSPVLDMRLPTTVRRAMAAPATSPPASPSVSPPSRASGQPALDSPNDPASHDAWPWVAGGLLGVAALRPR
jgi:hypothetical protein